MISSAITIVYDEARRIWYFRWLALGAAAVIATAGATAVSLMPDKYDAWGQVLVNKQTPLAAAAQSVSLIGEAYGSPYVVQKTLLNDENLEAVVRQIDPAAGRLDPTGMAAAVANLRNHIRITPDAGDGFIEFHYADSDPVRAQRMAKLLIDQFIARNLDRNRKDLGDAGAFLDNQIETYAGMVAESQAKIASFRRAQPLTRVVTVGSEPIAGGADAPLQSAALPPTTPLDQRVNELQTRVASLRQVYTTQYPDVIAAQRQLAQATSERDAAAALAPAAGQPAAHRAARRPLVHRSVVSVPVPPEVAARWSELQRADETLRSAYQQLIAKRQAARMSQAVYGADASAKYQITRAPTRPLTATGPNRRLYLAAVLVLALGGGLALAWLRAAIAGILVAPRELEQIFQLPVVGTVSWERTWETRRKARRPDRRRPALVAKPSFESANS